MSGPSDPAFTNTSDGPSPDEALRRKAPDPDNTPGLAAAASVFLSALIAELRRLARLTGRGLAAAGRWSWRHLTRTAQGTSRAGRAAYDRYRDSAAARDLAPVAPTPAVPLPRFRETARRQAGRRWRLLRSALIAVAAVVSLGSVLTAGVLIWAVRDMPLADILPPLEEPHLTVLTTEGETLYRKGAYRAGYVALSELPEDLIEAVIAVEDMRFHEHRGIDLRAIARAALHNLRSGGIAQGGSTITQQLVKVLYLEPERTFQRKLQEMVLAIALERQLGKERILELYLNSIYLGSGAWGAPAAAEVYFNRPASDLTLAQAATMAAAIRSPGQINLVTDAAATRERAALVLRLMEDQGRITDAERNAAEAELASLAATPPPTRAGSYYVDWVLEQAEEFSGAVDGRLSVTATLDPQLQAAAERIVADVMAGPGREAGASQAALVAMTPQGHVRAMVGGVDYAASQFNRATKALRQPGSTFKLPVYLTALAMGAAPDTVIIDAPIEIDGWSPKNYGGSFHGRVSLRQAFALSLNAATVRLAEAIGIENVVATARQLGIEGPLTETPSLALGTSEVTLLDMTEAYAAILAGRLPVRATGIASLSIGEDGTALTMAASAPDAVEMTHTREPMLEMLREVVLSGTGQGAHLPGFVAGKTGTSQDNRDAWFIGFSETLVIGVWVGNDGAAPMDGVTGGGIPVDIWRSVMDVAQQSGPQASAALPQALPTPVTLAPAPAQCDVRACSRAYRSFRASDCTFQPYRGGRQLCTR